MSLAPRHPIAPAARPARPPRRPHRACLALGPALALAAACGDNAPGPADAPPIFADAGPAVRAVVVAGNFQPGQAGVMSVLTLDPPAVATRVAPSAAIGSDPVLRRVGGELFVVNRADGNNVTILDAETYALIAQLSTGAGTNPQDVAVFGDRLYVPALDSAGVIAISRATRERTTVDLSALDPDGKPNCVTAYTVGSEVYVACGILDGNFVPRGPGRIAVLDGATGAVKTTFALASANPFGVLEQAPPGELSGDLVIPTVPSFGDFSTGCVERVRTGPSPAAAGCVVTNAQLGGYVARLAFQTEGARLLWLVVSKFDTAERGSLQSFDLAAAALSGPPVTPPSQVIVDATVCAGRAVVVADKTMAANGLRVLRDRAEVTAAPLAIGLRPASSNALVCLP